jgi:3-methyladenine DNA glycosylase/8-oxoguanine DNA glycosylase
MRGGPVELAPARTAARPLPGRAAGSPAGATIRVEVEPPWPFRLRGGSPDGLLRRRGRVLHRLLHRDGEAVHVRIVQAGPRRVVFEARGGSEAACAWGIARMRFATGVDDDLRPFHEAFHDDPVIGRAVRARPELRIRRTPVPWEALANAICEQLIEFDRAAAIQRRIIRGAGRGCACCGLRDAPPPAAVAGLAPARLTAWDLAPARALTLRRAAREVAAGRADLEAADPMPAWRRLRAVPGIGPWTLEVLALHGQGHHDRIPAGDLGYLKLVGRVRTADPQARVEEDEVRAFFARYGAWKGLAGEYLRVAAANGLLPARAVAA